MHARSGFFHHIAKPTPATPVTVPIGPRPPSPSCSPVLTRQAPHLPALACQLMARRRRYRCCTPAGPGGKIKTVAARTRIARMITLGAMLVAWVGLAVAPAQASEPLSLAEQVTDVTSDQVLDIEQAQAAVGELYEDTGYQLFVVFVDTFEGLNYEEWGEETAYLSNLGDRDLLLAVAVQDQAFATNISDAADLSSSAVADVEADIRAELSAENWTGAVEAAADGYAEAADGGGGALGLPLTLFLGGLAVIVLFAVIGGYRRSTRRARASAPGLPGPTSTSTDPYEGVSTEELRTRSGSALVGLDDDVRNFEQELRFARAQFGLEATVSFRDALEEAREHLREAFNLQREIEEGDRGRQGLIQILQACERGEQLLEAQMEELARLRQLERNVEQTLQELNQRAGELESRIPAARAALTTLQEIGRAH